MLRGRLLVAMTLLVWGLAACGGSDLRIGGDDDDDGAEDTLSVRGTLAGTAPVFPSGAADIVVLVYSGLSNLDRSCDGLHTLGAADGLDRIEGEASETFLVTGVPVGRLTVVFTRSTTDTTTDSVIDDTDDVAVLEDDLTGGSAGDVFLLDGIRIDFDECEATAESEQRL